MVGELHGTPVEINLGLLNIKEFELHGIQSANRDELQEVLEFMNKHKIQPLIWKSLPLDHAEEAHRDLASREVVGRILLMP